MLTWPFTTPCAALRPPRSLRPPLSQGYYLLLVTKKRYVGSLCGHKVYGIEATALVPLISSSTHKAFVRDDKEAAAAEARYRKLLAGGCLWAPAPLWLVGLVFGGWDCVCVGFATIDPALHAPAPCAVLLPALAAVQAQ